MLNADLNLVNATMRESGAFEALAALESGNALARWIRHSRANLHRLVTHLSKIKKIGDASLKTLARWKLVRFNSEVGENLHSIIALLVKSNLSWNAFLKG